MKPNRERRGGTNEPKGRGQPQAGTPAATPQTKPASQAAQPAVPTERVRGSAASLVFRWLVSPTLRQALQMRRHVWKLVQHQRDLLSPEALRALQKSMDGLRALFATGDKAALQAGMEALEKTANEHLKSYLFPSTRENIEVLLVAIAVAMAIRTFFLQPFKIPTGSMQPTLWGITSNPDYSNPDNIRLENRTWDDLRPKPDFEVPGPLRRFTDYWIKGVSYDQVVARTDGALRTVEERPAYLLPLLTGNFIKLDFVATRQRFWIGDDPEPYTIWFPPDNLLRRAGLLTPSGPNPKVFKKGEDIIKMRSVSGDHLFVDRLSYNFRRPERGEIVVFETRHVKHWAVPVDQFYIKRLVGLSDEALSINTNRHLVVNGKELTANTPRFENLYGYNPTPVPNHYYGHVPSEIFAGGVTNVVPHDCYMVMGDNTLNSLDSRYWGAFPREDVIGKAWFVYWPIDSGSGGGGRFGWGYR